MGKSIKVGGLRLCRGVGVSTGEIDRTLVINFYYEGFWKEAVGVGEGGGSDGGKGRGYALSKGV